jgi:hypothetical protein
MSEAHLVGFRVHMIRVVELCVNVMDPLSEGSKGLCWSVTHEGKKDRVI